MSGRGRYHSRYDEDDRSGSPRRGGYGARYDSEQDAHQRRDDRREITYRGTYSAHRRSDHDAYQRRNDRSAAFPSAVHPYASLPLVTVPYGPADDACAKHRNPNHTNRRCFDQQHLFVQNTPRSPLRQDRSGNTSHPGFSRLGPETPSSKRTRSGSPSDRAEWSSTPTPLRGSTGSRDTKRSRYASAVQASPPAFRLDGPWSTTKSPATQLPPRSYKPRKGYFHPNVEAVERRFHQLIQPLLLQYNTARNDYERNAVLKEKMAQIKEIADLVKNYPQLGPFVLVGPTCAGKSSLIAELLGLSEAVITNDGDRGTHSPIWYAAALPNQKSPYCVIPEFYGMEDLWSKLSDDIDNIRSYVMEGIELKHAEQEDPDSLRSHTARDSQASLQGAYDEGIKTVLSVVHDTSDIDFASADGLQSLLASGWINGRDEPINKVRSRVESVLGSLNRAPRDAQNGNDIWKIIMELSFENETFSSRAMLKKIWIRTDKSEALRDGLILADVPGFGDNEHRINSYTNESLSEAQAIFVVAPIQRWNKVSRLEAILRPALNARKPIYLVLSHIDQKDEILLKRIQDGKVREGDLREIERRQAKAATDDQAVSIAKQRLQHAEDYLEERDAKSDLMDALARQDKSQMRLLEIGIQVRNRMAKMDLCSLPKKILQSDRAEDLEIFFVSPKEHKKHRDSQSKEKPKMRPEATGIAEVTQKMYALTGGPNLRALQRVCVEQMPQRLDALIGIMRSTRPQRKVETLAQVDSALQSHNSGLREVFAARLAPLCAEKILHCYDLHQRDWATAANDLAHDWAKSIAVTYHALCRKNGDHKPAGAVASNPWNQQIQNVMSSDLRSMFDDVQILVGEVLEKAKPEIAIISSDLKRMLSTVEQLEDTNFEAIVDQCQPMMYEVLDEKVDHLCTRVEGFRRMLLFSADDSSYVSKAFHGAYRRAAAITSTDHRNDLDGLNKEEAAELMASKGKTPAQRAHRARIRIIHQALTGMDIEKQPYAERLKDKEFLPGLRAIVKKAWDDMIEAWLNTLHEVPAILEERIKTEFHKCYKVEGEIMIEEKLAEEMSTLAETARQELVGRIEPLLKECKE